MDKNYGGVLIIWDRLFGIVSIDSLNLLLNLEYNLLYNIKGTFAKEKPNEEIAYGLVHPVESFDPIYLQVNLYSF